MTQRAYAGTVEVHPTEAIEASGKTEAGRELSVYLTAEAADILRKTFALEAQAGHLGHAYWHVIRNEPVPCASCQAPTYYQAERQAALERERKALDGTLTEVLDD